MVRYPLGLLAVVTLSLSSARAAVPPAQTLCSAAVVLDEFTSASAHGVPPAVLARAHGVAVIPRMIKAGLVIGGRGGHGVVFVRRDKTWSDPVFVDLGGASVGLQAGFETADVVLVFTTRRSLDRLFEGKGKVTLGADAAAAAGPSGRHAAAATDGRLEAEILTYARSRGLFAGISLDGAVIRPDADANAAFARDSRPEVRSLVAGLKSRLGAMNTTAVPVGVTPVPASPVAVPQTPVLWSANPVEPDRIEMALSGLAAAAIGVAYRAARRRTGQVLRRRQWA